MADNMKKDLASGKLKTVEKEGKSAVWKSFDLVVNAEDDGVGFVQCKVCKLLMEYDSKTTGTSSLQRHLEKSCKPLAAAGDVLRQPKIN